MSDELKFQGTGIDRLPPQNIEAEEAILGGILLDPEAISRVCDRLVSDAFYLSAHRDIYQGMVQLHGQGKPTDLLTVTAWLTDHDLLTKVGGRSKLLSLLDQTVSAINIDALAQLVMDKYTRRQLIRAGNEVSQLGFETETDLSQVLDKAEQKVFGVTQERSQSGLVHIAETLIANFQDIEERNQGVALPGIPGGFYDLDAMINGGFQRSDLVIVAGRPAMGKCVAFDTEILLGDGSLAKIEDIYHSRHVKLLTLNSDWQFALTEPSAYIDDGIKPVFRVKTRLGRYVETTLTHPYLTINGWVPLAELNSGDKIAIPRQLNVFGTEEISVDKIKIIAENAHDKFIPEFIFKLTRSQVALFINRLFATDGWATLLTSGQAQIGYCTVSEKLARQIQHLLLRFGIIAALKIKSVKYQNTRRPAWQIDITDAYSLNKFITEIGIFGKEKAISQIELALENCPYQTNRDLIPVEIWQQLSLSKGNESWSGLAKRAGIRSYTNIHVGKRALSRERLAILARTLDDSNLQQLATSDIYWDEIISIEYVGEKQVYDLTIPHTHNFVANDICVHNTSFSMNIATYISGFMRLPVAIFSLEMSKEQLALRMLSGEAAIESSYLKSGRISQNQWESLTKAIGLLSEMPIYIDDTPNITINEMRSKARRLQAEQGTDLGLVLIDYLQLMEGNGDNRVQELSKITRGLKGLARELNVPVIALSQLSRSVEARTNKRPMLSDLRESGSIEQDADLVMMLYRDDYYNPDTPDRGVAEVIISKHRHGPTGTVKLLFDPQYTKFKNLARPGGY